MTNFDWTEISEAISENECVLLLGPGAACVDGTPLVELLTKQLAYKLKHDRPHLVLKYEEDFSYLCKTYEMGRNPEEARGELRWFIQQFYDSYKKRIIPLYDQIARLPFKYIINTMPDELILYAYERAGKEFADTNLYHYNYQDSAHNQDIDIREEDITEDTPLIVNLLGSLNRRDSLVLTEEDRLLYLDKVLQHDKESIPPSIAIHFAQSPRKRERKTFVFIGFDFNQWHQRMFMRMLNRYHRILPQSFVLQSPEELDGRTQYFYTESLRMVFLSEKPAYFFEELYQFLLKNSNKSDKPSKIELVIIYHQNNVALRDELETYLAPLRRSQIISIWHEGKILVGTESDALIEHHLNHAQVIVPLITADLLASSPELYSQLEHALERHQNGSARLIPILMEPCLWDHTFLGKVNTLLPTPRGKNLREKNNRQEALLDITRQLQKIVEKMADRS